MGGAPSPGSEDEVGHVGAAPFGVILAGGQSRRFGTPKALAEVGGKRIIERVRDTLRCVLPEVVLIANRPALFADLNLPTRPDEAEGAGPLGGIHSALRWAREEDRPGALCVACDMPFVSAPLLRMLLEGSEENGVDAVAPESVGRRFVEPLCAFYSVSALPKIESRIGQGNREMMDLLDALRTVYLPLAQVLRCGEPDVLFLNVNTPGEHEQAVRIARQEKSNAHG